MFRLKKDVDRHVHDIFRKLKNENERNVRCYNIAKLYYQVGDYESAKRYVSNYLEVRGGSAGAHKLLGQAYEALGQKEAALAQYKISLELEARQDDLVLKVCELLADMEVNMDVNRVRYWVERADKQFPHHPIVFQLKEKMITVERPNDNNEDLEALIASELSARPTDVHLRVKLLKHYAAKHKLDDAYNHIANVEAAYGHRNSIVWYQTLSELLAKCKESKQSDWSFWVLYVSVLERYAALSLKEQGNDVKKTIPEATQAVFNFDQSLMEIKSKNFTNNPAFIEHMLLHMWGQLHFHLACLFLRKTKREQGSWSEAGRLCAPLLLNALHVVPIDPIAPWAAHLKDRLKNQIRLWSREGSYRCSQSGHVLQDYAKDDIKKLMDKIDKFCTGSWRERIYKRIFVSRVHQQLIGSSYFSNNIVPNSPLRLCSNNELKRYDEVSEEVRPDSLHHQVWLGLKSRPHHIHNKDSGSYPHQISHVFSELQFSVYNLNQAAPDSLSRLDIDSFLNAAIFCATAVVEEQQLSGFLSPEKLPTLPADLTNTLCTCAQEKWWSSAYKMYSKQEALEGDIGEIRQELQRGLEVVRCIGNHGLHPSLIVHLARIFHHRVKILKDKDKEHTDIPALEARCEVYWSTAIPLLERLQNNQTIRITSPKLFNYQGKEMNNVELTNALEEGRLLLAQRFLRDKQYEQAIEALQDLKCPEASFQQGQIYKMLADEIVSSMPRESLTSEMRSQHIIMLSKARNCLYLTLDRLRSPGINPKHPLNSELCTHISDIENELKRIDPDLWRGDISRNECDVMSDESYSSAHSGVDQAITHAPLQNLTGLSTTGNILSTPQRNTHRTPKQSSTPCRPQHHDILDLSRNRTEARPSPERLDAQIRQMIHARDNTMQTIIEQNKTVMESNKVILDKIEELVKEIAELRKETQRQRPQTVNANNVNLNLEEDLYVLGDEELGDLNYTANQAGAASSISGNIYPSSHRHPYSPLLYQSTAFQGYYQGGIPFSDPTAPPIPSLYAPNVFPMPLLYPNRTKLAENILQQGLFTSRLPTQLTEQMPPTNQLLHMPPQKVDVTVKPDTGIKDAPVNKVPPVNVAITTSDTLPTTVPMVQPTLSVTVPAQYRLGATSTSTMVDHSTAPHCYQISMPLQATIPTTVNLPPLPATLITTPANISMPETSKSNIKISSVGSPNSSTEVCETEHDPIPDFIPVIPLPAEVKVTTGEENEITLHCARAKLFRFVDKEWKERGVGNVKLLQNAEGKVRLLMRRDQVLKICANHMLRSDMELIAMPHSETAWIWVANDFADEEVKLEKFCIKFKTAEEATLFKEHFDKAKAGLIPSPQSQSFPVSNKPRNKNETLVPGNGTTEKPKNTSVVGGFSFTSKPIIQKVNTTESTKTAQKAEDPAKISPFAGFSFNKTPIKQSENNMAPTLTTKSATTISTTSTTSQVPFSFVKLTPTHLESTPPIDFSNTTSGLSSITEQNVNAAHSSLRRPHIPSPASLAPTENEEVLFQGRTSLQCYNIDTKQWENRGTGQMKILNDTKTGKLRLLMVEEDGSTVYYAQNVSSEMTFSFKSGSNTTIHLSAQFHGKEDNKAGMVNLTFKLADQASQFYYTLLNNQRKIAESVSGENAKKYETKKQSANEVSKQSTTAEKSQTPLSELFKPAAGSWECSACYTRNNSTAMKCIACENPSTVPANKVTSAASSTTNQVPLSQMFKAPANSWECSSCYIINSNKNSYCVACDSPKDPSLPPKPKTNSFQLGTPASSSAPLAFSFGIPQDAAKDTPGGFSFRAPKPDDKTFGTTTNSTVPTNVEFTSKSNDTGAKLVFGSTQRPNTPPNGGTTLSFGSPGKSFGFNFVAKSPAKSPNKSLGGGENSEEEVVESDDIQFSPIIPLPDKIEVKTGEEDEEVLYSHRAKLFRYDTSVKEWKERGLGDIKLLRHRETGKLRLIMRRDHILKLCLNHLILPDLEFTSKDEKAWLWNAADYSEGEIVYMQFACRFKTPEIAAEFKKAIDNARSSEKTTNREREVKNGKERSKTSSPQDIEVLYEVKVTSEEKNAALLLQLPENFYAYKQKPDCAGCIGCKEPAIPLFDEKSSTESQTLEASKKSVATPIKFTGSSLQFPTSTAAVAPTADTKPQQTGVSADANNTNTTGSVFKIEFPIGKASTTFKQTPFSGATGFDTTAMSFGSGDANVFNDKKITGFSFAMPQNQFAKEHPPATTGSTTQSEKPAFMDKQINLLSENLKICSPSSQGQQAASNADTTTTNSPFSNDSSGEASFQVSASKGENTLGLNDIWSGRKNIFSGASKSAGANLIKPSIFSINAPTFGSTFGTQNKGAATTGIIAPNTLPATENTGGPTFGALPNPSIFESVGMLATSAATDSTSNSAPPSTNATITSAVEISSKPTNTVFDNTSIPFTLKQPFSMDSTNTAPFAISSTPTTNIFDTKPAERESKEEDVASFLPVNNLTFSTVAKFAPQQTFKIDPNFSFDGAGSSVFGGKSNSQSAKASLHEGKEDSQLKKKDGNEEDEEYNDQEHDPHFEPIVPLPDAIEVRTGEEDEDKVFCQRAKLYRYSNATREWKERGVGEMKILHHREHGTYRLLLRRDQVHKVVCNFLLTANVAFRALSSSDRTWIWAGMNHAEEQPSVEELGVKFKTLELAQQFKETIDNIQRMLREKQSAQGIAGREDTEDEQNQDDDEQDEDEEDDDDDVQNSIIFKTVATLFGKMNNDSKWTQIASGTLVIFYDSHIYGERIFLKLDDTGHIMTNTIISMDTHMQVDGKECIWTATDYALVPPVRRTLKAVFSFTEEAQEMYKFFQEGLECAKEADIREENF
ncbi:hypothetical protein KM043_014081 [Ampulex compressa]|nr:hypothetical protein KM043_014081 [Ampulex compressa]